LTRASVSVKGKKKDHHRIQKSGSAFHFSWEWLSFAKARREWVRCDGVTEFAVIQLVRNVAGHDFGIARVLRSAA
jgi:hypothetical protein